MNEYFDILLLITSVLATGFPIFVFLNSNRTKINRAKKLIELLEYRIKIQELRQKETEFQNVPLVKERLDSLLVEIDNDFKNKSEKSVRPNVWLFIVIVSIEIFLAFNTLSTIVISKSYESGFYFLEGVFKYPTIRIIGLLSIFLSSFLISFRLTNWIKDKINIKSNVKLSLYLTLLFNAIFLILGVGIAVVLALTDNYISWF